MTSAAACLSASALPPGEARALLAQVLGIGREELVAHPERAVGAPSRERFLGLAEQRARGTPMAYLLGEQEFYGHRFAVTPAVLVPRPETELLVDTVLESLDASAEAQVLELGTGSGCIAISLALARPHWRILATDRSLDALGIARANQRHLGARLELVAADWFRPIAGRFDCIVSNPPYIAAGDPHLPALRHEPRSALTDEGDGLQHLRAIAASARTHLHPGGHLVVEHGYDQGEAVRALLRGAGLVEVRTRRDLGGLERAAVARSAPAGSGAQANLGGAVGKARAGGSGIASSPSRTSSQRLRAEAPGIFVLPAARARWVELPGSAAA